MSRPPSLRTPEVLGGLAAIVLIACSGCGDAGPMLPPENTGLTYGGGSFSQQINVNGFPRNYVVYVPALARPETPAPLLFVYHGNQQTPESIRAQSGLDEIAGGAGYVVVYPLGHELRWKAVDELEPRTLSDIDFTLEMIERIADDIVIDRGRIYATGFSNGGQFVHRLGCELSETFAAIAPVAATFTIAVRDRCSQTDPMSVAIFLGDEDDQFPWEGSTVGGDGTVAALANLEYWADAGGCGGAATVTDLTDVDASDGTTVSLYAHTGCQAGAEVLMYRIRGGGHTWPGSSFGGGPIAGRHTNHISASDDIMNHFEANAQP
jgi:polyhydroxybutyrate depolymerase